MKLTKLLSIPFLLASVYGYTEGQQDLNGWNVRWSDTRESGSTYARIRKSEWVNDHDGMSKITMAIQQNIDNEVAINAIFVKGHASPPCSSSEKLRQVTARINSQEVRMELDIWEREDCDTHYSWSAITDEGKRFVRSSFNSGVLRFSHGSFDHIFDTRNSLPAYELMKEMVEKEEAAYKNAL